MSWLCQPLVKRLSRALGSSEQDARSREKGLSASDRTERHCELPINRGAICGFLYNSINSFDNFALLFIV
jgi:hypothetical protein